MQEDWHKGVRQEVEMLDKQQMLKKNFLKKIFGYREMRNFRKNIVYRPYNLVQIL